MLTNQTSLRKLTYLKYFPTSAHNYLIIKHNMGHNDHISQKGRNNIQFWINIMIFKIDLVNINKILR